MQQAIEQDKLALLQAGLAKIKAAFIEGLPGKVAEFDALMDRLFDESEDTDKVLEEIGQKAHKLHGQSGSFGFDHVGKIAAKVEYEVMRVLEGPTPRDVDGVEAYLVALLDQIEASLAEG